MMRSLKIAAIFCAVLTCAAVCAFPARANSTTADSVPAVAFLLDCSGNVTLDGDAAAYVNELRGVLEAIPVHARYDISFYLLNHNSRAPAKVDYNWLWSAEENLSYLYDGIVGALRTNDREDASYANALLQASAFLDSPQDTLVFLITKSRDYARHKNDADYETTLNASFAEETGAERLAALQNAGLHFVFIGPPSQRDGYAPADIGYARFLQEYIGAYGSIWSTDGYEGGLSGIVCLELSEFLAWQGVIVRADGGEGIVRGATSRQYSFEAPENGVWIDPRLFLIGVEEFTEYGVTQKRLAEPVFTNSAELKITNMHGGERMVVDIPLDKLERYGLPRGVLIGTGDEHIVDAIAYAEGPVRAYVVANGFHYIEPPQETPAPIIAEDEEAAPVAAPAIIVPDPEESEEVTPDGGDQGFGERFIGAVRDYWWLYIAISIVAFIILVIVINGFSKKAEREKESGAEAETPGEPKKIAENKGSDAPNGGADALKKMLADGPVTLEGVKRHWETDVPYEDILRRRVASPEEVKVKEQALIEKHDKLVARKAERDDQILWGEDGATVRLIVDEYYGGKKDFLLPIEKDAAVDLLEIFRNYGAKYKQMRSRDESLTATWTGDELSVGGNLLGGRGEMRLKPGEYLRFAPDADEADDGEIEGIGRAVRTDAIKITLVCYGPWDEI